MMQKPNAFPENNDASLGQISDMCGYDLNTKPLNGSPERHPDKLHPPKVKLEVNLDAPAKNTRFSARKRKFTEVEKVSTNRFTDNRLINFDQPSFGGSSNHVLPTTLSLWENKPKNNGKCKQVSLPPLRQDLNHSYAPVLADEPELILMSCLHCYLHVMVCDPYPKCPKCRKGEHLLDMYRYR